jgi:hypothetical protein
MKRGLFLSLKELRGYYSEDALIYREQNLFTGGKNEEQNRHAPGGRIDGPGHLAAFFAR